MRVTTTLPQDIAVLVVVPYDPYELKKTRKTSKTKNEPTRVKACFLLCESKSMDTLQSDFSLPFSLNTIDTFQTLFQIMVLYKFVHYAHVKTAKVFE